MNPEQEFNAMQTLMDDVWIAAGGKLGDGASQEQIIAAVKSLRALCDKFTEIMVGSMSRTELIAMIGHAKSATQWRPSSEPKQVAVSPYKDSIEGTAK